MADLTTKYLGIKLKNPVIVSSSSLTASADKIVDNAREFLQTINKLKPTSAKGTYMKSVYLSSTMSPGLAIDIKSIDD